MFWVETIRKIEHITIYELNMTKIDTRSLKKLFNELYMNSTKTESLK